MAGSNHKPIKLPLIFISDFCQKQWAELATSEEKPFVEARNALNLPRHRVSETGNSYRVINNWSQSGLLFEGDEREGGWRKFSVVEMLWIFILRELRTLGFSLPKLANLKQDLFYFDAGNGAFFDTSLVAFYLSCAMQRKDVVLVVDVDGNGSICLNAEYESSQLIKPLPISYVLVNINKLYADMTKNPEVGKKNNVLLPLSQKEIDILHGIAFENVSEVRITTKENRINKVEMKKNYQNPTEALKMARELMRDGKRKKISFEVQDGKVIAIEETEKN